MGFLFEIGVVNKSSSAFRAGDGSEENEDDDVKVDVETEEAAVGLANELKWPLSFALMSAA